MLSRFSAWLRSYPRSIVLTMALSVTVFLTYVLNPDAMFKAALWCWPLRNRGTNMYTQSQK